MKRFLDLADFDRAEILDLLSLAQSLDEHPPGPVLAGKVLGLVFLNPSLRTLASFQTAMGRLGGTSFVITPGQGTWQLETRPNTVMDGAAAEHIREGIPVLASYCDALGVRAFAEGKDLKEDLDERVFRSVDKLCDAPLINLESAMNHPCQALADWRTLDELEVPQRAKFVLCWTYHPRALPLAVPSAIVHMAAMRGMNVVVARPEAVRAAGRGHGQGASPPRAHPAARSPRPTIAARRSRTRTSYTRRNGAAPPTTAMPRPMRVRAPARRTGACARSGSPGASPGAKLMHCLPVRRNVSVADHVLDGARSAVLLEARNRLTVQTAVLYRMLAGAV